LKVSRLSMTPLSSTHSLLHLSALTRNTDTRLEQLGVGDVKISPLEASLCHSQLGYACTKIKIFNHHIAVVQSSYYNNIIANESKYSNFKFIRSEFTRIFNTRIQNLFTCNNGDLWVSKFTPARLRGTHANVAGFPLKSLGVVMNILSQPVEHETERK